MLWNRFIKFLIIFLIASPCFSQEEIADFEEGSIPILNEELRKLRSAGLNAIEHSITRGFGIGDVSNDDTTVTVEAGTLYNGSTKVNKTANTVLTFATASDWWDEATHSYSGGAGWCYIGVNPSGDIKFLYTHVENRADTEGNSAGKLYYFYDSGVYWRVIMAVYVDTDDKIHTSGAGFQTGTWFYLKEPALGVDFHLMAVYVKYFQNHLSFPWNGWKYIWFGGAPLFDDYPLLHFYLAIPWANIFGVFRGVQLYLLFTLFFLFTTLRILESRHWRG